MRARYQGGGFQKPGKAGPGGGVLIGKWMKICGAVAVCALCAGLLAGAYARFWQRHEPEVNLVDVTVQGTQPGVLLVNKQNRLPGGYVPEDLTEVRVPFYEGALPERRLMRREAARALERLFEGAQSEGIELEAVSGYRSYETQSEIYARRLAESGQDYVSRYIARPGMSEHQTGLAMDVACLGSGGSLTSSFADTDQGRWLAQNAHRFGFVLRYLQGKEAETGYAWEPWHIRYVGEDAQAIYASGTTLEAYLGAVYVSGN